MKQGFTLIELLVVITIMTILSVASVLGYRSYQTRNNLTATIQDARDLLNTALSLSLSPPANDIGVEGYGVQFTKGSNTKMILFVDRNNNKIYDGGNEKTREETLRKGVSINIFDKIDHNNISTQLTGNPNTITVLFKLPISTVDNPYNKETFFAGISQLLDPADSYSYPITGEIFFQRGSDTKAVQITTGTGLISIH